MSGSNKNKVRRKYEILEASSICPLPDGIPLCAGIGDKEHRNRNDRNSWNFIRRYIPFSHGIDSSFIMG